MLVLVEKVNEEASLSTFELEEVDEYLKYPIQCSDSSPLGFWKENEKKFPTLAALARFYLAIPATSGSIERLFSVAGAIGRSRRARINTSLLEKSLTVRQHLLNSMK